MVVGSPASQPGEASPHVRSITASTRHEEGRSVVTEGEARREAREPGVTIVHQATQGRVRLTNGAGSSPRGARGSTTIDSRSDWGRAHTFHLLDDDASLRELAGLELGAQAFRSAVGAPWLRLEL